MVRFLVQYGPATIGLLIALAFLPFNRTQQAGLPRPARFMTGLSLSVVTLFYAAYYASRVSPGWQLPLPFPSGSNGFLYSHSFTYALPLALTIIVLVFLIFPMPASGPSGTATLAPRGFKTFVQRQWVMTIFTLALGSFFIAVLAGLASSPDEQGRYVMYILQVSEVSSAGSTIYGWWFSMPSLLLIAVLVAVTFWGILAISRPALAIDAVLDTKIRTVRVRNILVVSSGGLLLHLAAVLGSLDGTASGTAQFNDGDQTFSFVTSWGALHPVLLIASFACLILGLAFWWSVMLSALTAKTIMASKAVAP